MKIHNNNRYYLVGFYVFVLYLFKLTDEKIKAMCEICSKLPIKKSERCQQPWSGVFIVNLEQISHIVLMFSLLTLTSKCRLCILTR